MTGTSGLTFSAGSLDPVTVDEGVRLEGAAKGCGLPSGAVVPGGAATTFAEDVALFGLGPAPRCLGRGDWMTTVNSPAGAIGVLAGAGGGAGGAAVGAVARAVATAVGNAGAGCESGR